MAHLSSESQTCISTSLVHILTWMSQRHLKISSSKLPAPKTPLPRFSFSLSGFTQCSSQKPRSDPYSYFPALSPDIPSLILLAKRLQSTIFSPHWSFSPHCLLSGPLQWAPGWFPCIHPSLSLAYGQGNSFNIQVSPFTVSVFRGFLRPQNKAQSSSQDLCVLVHGLQGPAAPVNSSCVTPASLTMRHSHLHSHSHFSHLRASTHVALSF